MSAPFVAFAGRHRQPTTEPEWRSHAASGGRRRHRRRHRAVAENAGACPSAEAALAFAGNPQHVGRPADVPVTATSDHRSMSRIYPIVDLAERHSDDLDVVLFWARRSGRVWVSVTHRRSGRTARIDATTANALEIFHHPFAYVPKAA
jgi:hypothetical protein